MENPSIEKEKKFPTLRLADVMAGHWFGTKKPPFVVREMFIQQNSSLYDKAKKVFESLQTGQEDLLVTVEADLGGGKRETVEIKVRKGEDAPDYMRFLAYPTSQVYYLDL